VNVVIVIFIMNYAFHQPRHSESFLLEDRVSSVTAPSLYLLMVARCVLSLDLFSLGLTTPTAIRLSHSGKIVLLAKVFIAHIDGEISHLVLVVSFLMP